MEHGCRSKNIILATAFHSHLTDKHESHLSGNITEILQLLQSTKDLSRYFTNLGLLGGWYNTLWSRQDNIYKNDSNIDCDVGCNDSNTDCKKELSKIICNCTSSSSTIHSILLRF